MDFESLLFKYLQHVQETEDTLLLELIGTPFSNTEFTADELLYLRKIEASLSPNHKLKRL
jgi:hypothetical protein